MARSRKPGPLVMGAKRCARFMLGDEVFGSLASLGERPTRRNSAYGVVHRRFKHHVVIKRDDGSTLTVPCAFVKTRLARMR